MSAADCPLCSSDGGELVWRDAALRLIVADEAGYPGFCRVIWNAHVAELSDLDEAARTQLMRAVMAVERVVRRVMMPAKINLASLGNQVPHLHWHVIPRYLDDAHFPAPVWAAPVRTVDPARLAERRRQAATLPALLLAELRGEEARWPA